MGQAEHLTIPKLTPEEQRRALEAMEAASKLRAEILAKRGGKLVSVHLSPWEPPRRACCMSSNAVQPRHERDDVAAGA